MNSNTIQTQNKTQIKGTANTRIIDIAEHFQCMAGDCPDTCCKGWKIPVDPEAVERYQTEPKLVAAKISRHVRGKELQFFRKKHGQCPFYTGEGLCQLQKEYGADTMPFVCREYPHKTIGCGSLTEVTLELSCPKAAELLMKNLGRIEYKEIEAQYPIMWEIGNDDPKFLALLQKTRMEILDYYWCGNNKRNDNDYTCWNNYDKLQIIYQYTDTLHNLIVRNQLQEASEISIDQILQERQIKESEREQADQKPENSYQLFYPMDMVDRMISYHIAHPKLRVVNPILREMIRQYYRCFNEYTSEQAAEVYAEKFEEMVTETPELLLKYQTYFSYYMQQAWNMAYEDYHILRIMMLGILYQELLMIFDVAEYMQRGTGDQERQARMIAAFEKRVRHNVGITDGMMNRIRKEFLMPEEC